MFGQPKKTNSEEKPLTFREKMDAEKKAAQRRKVNIFLSRRSGEVGSTEYQTSRTTFGSGEVESRSRVSRVGASAENQSGGFAGARTAGRPGFAKGVPGGKVNSASADSKTPNKAPLRPLGFK